MRLRPSRQYLSIQLAPPRSVTTNRNPASLPRRSMYTPGSKIVFRSIVFCVGRSRNLDLIFFDFAILNPLVGTSIRPRVSRVHNPPTGGINEFHQQIEALIQGLPRPVRGQTRGLIVRLQIFRFRCCVARRGSRGRGQVHRIVGACVAAGVRLSRCPWSIEIRRPRGLDGKVDALRVSAIAPCSRHVLRPMTIAAQSGGASRVVTTTAVRSQSSSNASGLSA